MITFRKIDQSNYMDCICLKVRDDQTGFVADNARSLVEAWFEEGLYTRAIYSDDTMVGFVLFDYDPEIPGWCMSRFMIGAQYQGQGLGKEAVLRFLEFMKEERKVEELYLHVELENTAAYQMYEKLGFRTVGEIQYTFDGTTYRERRMMRRL